MKNKKLLEKIKNKKAKIGVIGLGYVGLPLAILFAKKGFGVTGFVRTLEKAKALNNGSHHLGDTSVDKDLKEVLSKKTFLVRATNVSDLELLDIIVICVPTPVNSDKKPDLTDLKAVGSLLSKINIENKLIVNESTVAPFTTREILGNLGKNYFLVCSPERIDPGNSLKTVENIQKVIGGKDPESLLLGKNLYEKILNNKVVEVRSLEAAEMTKMLENTYRAVNIALINQFAKLSDKCHLDILDIINAAQSKWSFQVHYPSLGVGGHCIPVDPYYILELAKKYKVDMKVIENGLLENESMPSYLAEKVKNNYKKGMKVLVYGLTYKKGVNDLRESPVVVFCNNLNRKGITFSVYDPLIAPSKIAELGFSPGKLEKTDLFIVGTDHEQLGIDYLSAIDENTIIVDGRNFFKNKKGKEVLGIGRTLL